MTTPESLPVAEFDRIMETNYPTIPWRKPVTVGMLESGHAKIACRLCIGRLGFRAKDLAVCAFAFPVNDQDAFRRHMQTTHGGSMPCSTEQP